MSVPTRAVDALLEATVVASFSRIGYQARGRLQGWADDRLPRLDGRTALVTGATSGIGLATATALASLGASVVIAGRDRRRAEAAVRSMVAPGAGRVSYRLADMSDPASVRQLAAEFTASGAPLDVLVHGAGALSPSYRAAADGSESTLATHVLGPFLLTGLLLPVLTRSPSGRVITVSSGGMYTQRLDVARLEMSPADYDGAVAYARSKRAQVVLSEEWSRRLPGGRVVFHSMHPGWVDTPGLASGLPAFHRIMGPMLRTPDQGADTVVWLAAADEPGRSSGGFWFDRRRRGQHHLPWTRRADDGGSLWRFCVERTHYDPFPPSPDGTGRMAGPTPARSRRPPA